MSWTKNNEWLKPIHDQRIRWPQLKRFLANYRQFRNLLAGAAALAFIGSVTAFAIPMIFRFVQRSLAAGDQSLLILALAAYLAITFFETATTFFIRIIISRVSTRLNRDLALQYYRKILNLSVEDFIAFRRRTNLYQRIIDAMSITPQVTNILVRGGQLAIVVVIVGAVIGTLSPVVLGVLATAAGLLFAHVLVWSRKLGDLRQRSLAVNYPLVGKMTEVIGGLFTIKALAASVRVTSDIRKLVESKTDADYAERAAEVKSDQIAQALRTAALVAALGTSFGLMLGGSLELAEVFAVYLLTTLFMQPVSELAAYYQMLSRLSVNINNFYEVLDLQDEAAETRAALAERIDAESLAALDPASAATALDAVKLPVTADSDHAPRNGIHLNGNHTNGSHTNGTAQSPPLQPIEIKGRDATALRLPNGRLGGHIVFRNVAFAYRNGKEVLSNVNLEIQPGENISLIGRSGVGKTTLLRLLLGFLQPQRGQILVDGIDISALPDKNVYRRQFGVVSQQDFFFGTSIRENLTFGLDHDVSDSRIEEALGLVMLWDDVVKLPEGLDTTYSADLFSGGQLQRFFIARALLRQPSIVLLDEPTSALDFESEHQVMGAIDRLVGHNTTITIAHRLSTVRNADRVVVLHAGEVKAAGSHDQLYQSDDYYRSLCDYNSFVV